MGNSGSSEAKETKQAPSVNTQPTPPPGTPPDSAFITESRDVTLTTNVNASVLAEPAKEPAAVASSGGGKRKNTKNNKYTRTSKKINVILKKGENPVVRTVYIRTRDNCPCVRHGTTASGKIRYVPTANYKTK
jgi:hypothetical protein